MAIISNLTLRGYLDSLPSGALQFSPADIVNLNAPASVNYLSLANGDNSITIPALAIGCIILFNSASTTVKKIKGAGADTGIALSKTSWLVLSFTAGAMGSFIINSSAADTGLYTEIVFF